jgi:hypothetical protein
MGNQKTNSMQEEYLSNQVEDEYLTRCVVDTSTKTFNLFSNLGNQKTVKCENTEEFMNVLNVVRTKLDDRSELVYADPLTKIAL